MSGSIEKRYVFVMESLTHGGAERVVTQLANTWAEAGRSVTVILLSGLSAEDFYSLDSRVKLDRLDQKFSSVHSSHIRGPVSFLKNIGLKIFYLRRLLIDIRKSTTDKIVLISFLAQPNIITLLASAGLSFKTIISERVHPKFSVGKLGSIGRALSYWLADVIVVQTEISRAWFRMGLRQKTVVIPNWVSKLPDADGSIKRENVIVTAGRLAPQKRQDLLIHAFEKVHRDHPGWSLEIYGEGELKDSLRALIDKYQLNAKVHLKGLHSKLWSVFDRAGLFVLSSEYEGFPNVLLEAMSRGCPCISTDCPSGPRDLVENDVSGILVPTQDVDSLAKVLSSLMLDSARRASFGLRAKERAEDFNQEKIYQLWNRVCD